MFHTFHTFINYILTLITVFKSYVRYEHMLTHLVRPVFSQCANKRLPTRCWTLCAGRALALSCSFCILLCPSGPRKGDRMPKSLIL